ncbi:MAG: CYTH domain-containing protein [Candidatus Woesearchaeota archaeon]
MEKRSKLSLDEFDTLKSYLDINAEFLGKKEMKSYLFRKPTFLRIRLIAGKNTAEITEKGGDYAQVGRLENEEELSLDKLPEYLNTLKKQGYTECSLIHTTRQSYQMNGLKVELNDIDYLGLIVEIEALTEDEDKIPLLNSQIKKTMQELKLKELDASKYQSMMNSMYLQTLKNIKDQTFSI